MKLEIENISLNIDGNLIIDNLNLNIYEQEIISIIGPSASGKSSLLRIIAGFENINSGSVKINGVTVDDRSKVVEPQNRKVGIIFQDLALFPHLNCENNILFGIEKHTPTEKSKRLERLSTLLDISGILKSFPHEISGGQQQRVAIARALVNKPSIIFADEPTGNLDSKTEADVMNLFKELNDAGQTIILITHEQEIADKCKRVISIRDGLIESDKINTNI